MDKKFKIRPVSDSLRPALQQKLDGKTKPLGALGVLEDLAMQIGLIQQTLAPTLSHPHIVVFAGDHGIAKEGVSAYPQEVTWQMIMNFVQGGAAINVFCKQHGISLSIVDAGVNYDFPEGLHGIINNKIAKGTFNFAQEPAMSVQQVHPCIDAGSDVVKAIQNTGCNVIGFGEMGIGNTSSASVIMSVLCNIPIDQCVGSGTGLSEHALQHKTAVLMKAIKKYEIPDDPIKLLAIFGGFEIAQMTGAMLQSAECNMIILVDGFISTTAYLLAHAINPAVKDYCIFCHQSKEKGHSLMFQSIGRRPVLNLDMRLGEGTGAAVAFPILQSSVAFLNEMASFESAGVSNKG